MKVKCRVQTKQIKGLRMDGSPIMEYYEYCQVVGNEIVFSRNESSSSIGNNEVPSEDTDLHSHQGQDREELSRDEIDDDSQSCNEETISLMETDLSDYFGQDLPDETDGAWSHEDIICLIDYYEENREAFRLKPHKLLWGRLAGMLGRTSKQCCDKFHALKDTYLKNWEKKLNGGKVTWLYFQPLDALFHGSPVLPTLMGDELGEPVELWSAAEINQLIYLYGENLEKINSKRSMYAWKGLAKNLGRPVEDCSNMLNYMKHIYSLNLERLKNGHGICWPYFDAMHEVCERNGQELVTNNKREYCSTSAEESCNTPISNERSRPSSSINVSPECPDTSDFPASKCITANWNHKDILMLIAFYENNIDAFKTGKTGGLWRVLGKMLNREPEECSLKFRNMKTTYMLNSKRLFAGERVKWHYFDHFDKLFRGDTLLVGEREVNTNVRSPPQKFIWPHEDVLHLISYCKENMEGLIVKRPGKLWPGLASSLGRTVGDCDSKFRKLKHTYLINLKRKKAGYEVKWPYFKKFHEVFEEKKPKNFEILGSTDAIKLSPNNIRLKLIKKEGTSCDDLLRKQKR